jgi:leucyl aminopeptidase
MTGGNELNAPNTIDNCQDGNSGNYHSDESIDKIVVRSGDVSGNGAGESMRAGQKATIIATVFAWGTGTSDTADFYYSTNSSPTWTLIGTKKPSGGGVTEIKIDYQLPEASIHRVRVNFRYNGSVRYVIVLFCSILSSICSVLITHHHNLKVHARLAHGTITTI